MSEPKTSLSVSTALINTARDAHDELAEATSHQVVDAALIVLATTKDALPPVETKRERKRRAGQARGKQLQGKPAINPRVTENLKWNKK